MRAILALGCCGLYLAFGLTAGFAHLHESDNHHAESRGLHLDHAHLGDLADHGHGRHFGHESPHAGDARPDSPHIGHHDDDVLFLNTPALRSLDPTLRLLPATVSVVATIDCSWPMSGGDEATPAQPRDPPPGSPARPRAPPA